MPGMASSAKDSCTNLETLLERCREKQPVEERHQRTISPCIIDWRANGQSVDLLKLLGHLIDHVLIKDTVSQLTALIASDATSDVLMPYVDNFCFKADLLQFVSRYAQSRKGTACAWGLPLISNTFIRRSR